MLRPSRTKIVATIGPSCDSVERLAELVRSGVDVFRINTAHGTREDHQQRIEKVRSAEGMVGTPVAVLVDLAGPKMRLGELPGGAVTCAMGQTVRFMRIGRPLGPQDLVCTYEPLLTEIEAGDRIMLADGQVGLTVNSVSEELAECQVFQAGTVRSRQGVNLPGVKLSVPALSPKDRETAEWAVQAGADFVSLSFVRKAEDIRVLRLLLEEVWNELHPQSSLSRDETPPHPGSPDASSCPQIIAKIEKPEALAELEGIVRAADGVMVARGDLGVEVDIAQMAVIQKRIVRTCREQGKPVIIATQMLESMHNSTLPTRAEATDVANAIIDGADACMLSGETAVGQFPVEAVKMMHRIALSTEELITVRSGLSQEDAKQKDGDAVTGCTAAAAAMLSSQLGARLLVVGSATGASALSVSQHRMPVPVVGISETPHMLRRMCLYWGVTPLQGQRPKEIGQLVSDIERTCGPSFNLKRGDNVVVLYGHRFSPGRHNMILVHQVGK